MDIPRPPGVDKLDIIISEIRETRNVLETKIDTLALDVGIFREEQRKTKKGASKHLRHQNPYSNCHDHTTQIVQLSEHIRRLEDRAEDTEGRMLRNNVRIIGLPEGEEGTNVTTYVESWLRQEIAPRAYQLYTR